MRIGIDARAMSLSHFRGIASYIRGLTREFVRDEHNQIVFFTNAPINPLFQLPPSVQPKVFRLRGDRFYAWEQLGLPVMAMKSGVDVMHSVADTCPCWQPKPWVITMHDLNLHFGDGDEPAGFLRYVRHWVPRFARRAKFVLTVSEYSRQDIIRKLKIPEDKVVSVYPGRYEELETPPSDKAKRALCAKYKLTFPLVFSIVAPSPRKNSHRLMRAFEQLHDCVPEVCTVVTGAHGAFGEEMAALSPRTIRLPYLPLEELRVLHHVATVYVCASLFEGFGAPVLDSITAGTPLVFANVTAIPEVAGNCGLPVDPRSESEIVKAIQTMITSPELQKRFRAAALIHSRKFSWQTAAQQVLELYERASA
jgi:glycosyltransferase involved in cell wall biosynthesis